MKKLGIIVLAVALVAALTLPYVFGTFTEDQVQARVAQLSQEGGWIDADMRSYQRGWFGSAAKIDVVLSPASLAQLDEMGARAPDPRAASAVIALAAILSRPFTVDVQMSHGPLMLQDGADLGFSRMTARLDPDTEGLDALLETLGIPYLFEFRGRTGLDGVFRFDADSPPIDHTDDGDRLHSSGMQLEGRVNAERVSARAQAESLAIATGPWRLEVEGFTAEGDNILFPEGLVLGSFETRLDRVTLHNHDVSDAPLFEAVRPSFAGDLDRNGTGALVDAEIRKSVERLRAGEILLEGAAFGMSARNLDIVAVRQYYDAAQRDFAAAPPARALLARLLGASPTIALEPVRFRLNGESFEASLEAEVRGGAVPASTGLDVLDRALWADILTGAASINLSKTLAEDLAVEFGKMQLRGTGQLSDEEIEASVASQVGLILLVMSAQGFLQEIGDNYAMEIRYADGTLRVNGRELPLGLALR
jgi:uncharacterized protein YdgA (DUF945 family)